MSRKCRIRLVFFDLAVLCSVLTYREQYDFLAHAILGLGASHLSAMTSTNHFNFALNHRIASISALNEQLSRTHISRADADATLGALLALTFQSAYMADGMVEFLTMIRGCKWHDVP